MRFEIQRQGDKQWSITPTQGELMGHMLAFVEGVTLKNVELIAGMYLVGEIEAIWGAEVFSLAYEDLDTVEALRFNKAFNIHGSVNQGTVRHVISDGGAWLDGSTKKQVRQAGRAIVLGNTVRVSAQAS